MVTKDYTDINLELFLFPYNCRSVIIVFQLSPFFKKTQTLSTIFFINNDGTKKSQLGNMSKKKELIDGVQALRPSMTSILSY